MKRVINESEHDNIKKVVFKYYDKIKLQGKKPRVDDPVVKAILTGFDEQFIKMIFIEYLGGEDNIINNLKRITKGKVFDTDDYKYEISVGTYSFRFKLKLLDDNGRWDADINLLAQIMDGELTLIDSGHRIDFNDLGDEEHEDILWEITNEIGDIVSAIYSKIFEPYTGLSFSVSVDYL